MKDPLIEALHQYLKACDWRLVSREELCRLLKWWIRQ